MGGPRTYRIYRLDSGGKLAGGEWITAADDAEALEAALKLCGEGTPAVEVWEGRRLVGVSHCPKHGPAATIRPSLGP